MIDEITIRRIKDAANIVDVIGDWYPLTKNGQNYECLCPFHDDKRLGSFKVSERRNTFHCFSCGARGSSIDFLMMHEGYGYVECLQYLGKKYGIPVEGSDNLKAIVRHSKPHAPVPRLPVLNIDYRIVERSLHTDEDTLCKWIRSLPWDDQQKARVEKVLHNYLVGHGKDGHTIFWQVDDTGKVRTGKLMRYKPDGHREKTKGSFNWTHSMLAKVGIVDGENTQLEQCLYGLHLLGVACPKIVNIVESEKTALVCAIAYGGFSDQLWMATGGLSNLTRDKLEPLIKAGREIVLFPDRDGKDKWLQAAEVIGYNKLHVNTRVVTRYWREEDGEKADIADIIVRMMVKGEIKTKGDKLASLIGQNPAVRELIDKFNLILQ